MQTRFSYSFQNKKCKRYWKQKIFSFLWMIFLFLSFFSIGHETQCGSFSHPELLQTRVIMVVKEEEKKLKFAFFSKRKESHTPTTYCIKRSITITPTPITYFNRIYIFLNLKVSRRWIEVISMKIKKISSVI